MGFKAKSLTHWYIECGTDHWLNVSQPYPSLAAALVRCAQLDLENPACAPHRARSVRVPIEGEGIEGAS